MTNTQLQLPVLSDDKMWMRQALSLAECAANQQEVPVGAIVVLEGQVIGRGWNQPISGHDPTAHAEIMALRDAAKRIGNYRLSGASMYVTIEPCSMCAGAIVHARIKRLVFGATEPKAGVIESQTQFFAQPWLNHVVEWQGGVLADACSHRISEFFRWRREEKMLLKQAAKSDQSASE